MKKFLIIFLAFFLFACGNNSQKVAENLQTETEKVANISENTEKIKIAENLTFSNGDMDDFFDNIEQKWIIFSHTDVPEYWSDSEGKWVRSSQNTENLHQNSKISYSVRTDVYDNIDEIHEYISTNPHIEYNILRLFGHFSDAEILKIFEILEQRSGKLDFVVVDGISRENLKNAEIREKFENYQKKFSEIFSEKSVNIETNTVMAMDSNYNDAYFIDDDSRVYIEVVLPREGQEFAYDSRFFVSIENFEKFLQKNPKIRSVQIGKENMSNYFPFRLTREAEPLYSDEVFMQILDTLKNHKNFDERLHIEGLKKIHFENEKILEKLAEIEAKNLILQVEYDSSLELRQEFYEKLLNAKAKNTITFDAFGVWVDEIFCNFLTKDENIEKIIYRENRPFLFCLGEVAKIWNEENRKVMDVRDETAE